MSVIFIIANILCIALPVAVLEVAMEKDKGWGAGFDRNTWYGAILWRDNRIAQFFVTLIGIPYFFGYGVLMYFLLIPGILVLEYFFLMPNVPLLLAAYIGVLVVEDFMWFVINPYFPALTELLKGPHGSIWWHQRWMRIGEGRYLPASYLTGITLVVLVVLWAKLH